MRGAEVEKPGGVAAGAVIALAFALAAFALFARDHRFPFYYHPDEPGKTDQVLGEAFNFHHPLLLLEATRLVLGSSIPEMNAQQVAEAGRLVSAGFSAIAVGAFALLGWLHRGWIGAAGAGLLLMLNQQVFELAHYMKEDAALLGGVSLTLLALGWFARAPGIWPALACGAACGVAISGKYAGALLLPFAIAVLVLETSGARRRLAIVSLFIATLLAVALAVNWPLLEARAVFESSLGREVEFVVKGSKGMTRGVPHTLYLRVFADNTTPLIWLLLGGYFFAFWRDRRRRDAAEWATALFPIVFLIILSFSPKTNDRYFLPSTATVYFLAVCGAVDLAGIIRQRAPQFAWGTTRIAAALLLAAAAWELPRFLDVQRAFSRDDRRELIAFVAESLPPAAKIAQDIRVELPDPKNRKRHRALPNPLRQTVVSGKRYAAELGTLEELRRQGFTHVAVSESNYGRFFLESMRPLEGYREEYGARREFYERLFKEGRLLFERPRGTVIYLHPGLKLYELPNAG
jgi:hypothetical protein